MDIYRQVEKRSGASGWRRKWSGKEERGRRSGEIRNGGAGRGDGGVGKFGVGERREEVEMGNLRTGRNIQPQTTIYSI